MADFSFLSESDDEKAIQELLSQAMDQSVLEQVAAINCSGFTDSVLPSHLETRFRRLKSFPATISKPLNPAAATSKSIDLSQSVEHQGKEGHQTVEENLDYFSAGSKRIPSRKVELEVKSGSGSSSSSVRESLSPPARSGCLWCSPKEKKKKKGKENRGMSKRFDLDKIDGELLSDLGSFSRKKQEKMLKKAIKEEEKISREAEKIVKWAKQASARMEFDDHDLSDKGT